MLALSLRCLSVRGYLSGTLSLLLPPSIHCHFPRTFPSLSTRSFHNFSPRGQIVVFICSMEMLERNFPFPFPFHYTHTHTRPNGKRCPMRDFPAWHLRFSAHFVLYWTVCHMTFSILRAAPAACEHNPHAQHESGRNRLGLGRSTPSTWNRMKLKGA